MLSKNSEECFKSICTFYLLSSCTKGRKCRFLHDIPNNIGLESPGRKDPCYFFLKGKCNDGESCQRSHNQPPSFNGTIKKMCMHYSQGRCDRGKLCSYSHDLPFYRSPVSITVDSESKNCPPENINVVSPVIINTSDDVQSMTVTSKLCHFYQRGMCFFGQNCTNFHDKPEKEPEDFISGLRENEVLNEKKLSDSIDKRDINSINLTVGLTKNKEIYLNALEVIGKGCLNLNNQCKSCDDTNSFSKSEELQCIPFVSSPKRNELFKVLNCRSAKSAEIIEEPCRPKNPTEINLDRYRSEKSLVMSEDHYKFENSTDRTGEPTREPSSVLKLANLTKDLSHSSTSVEITKYPSSSSNIRTSRTSLNSIILGDTSSKPKEFFRESSTSSKAKEVLKGTHIFSKSKEFTRNTYSSNYKEFIKSNEYSRSKDSHSTKLSNSSYSFAHPKEFFRSQHSSKSNELPGSPCLDNPRTAKRSKDAGAYLKLEEFPRNSEVLKKQSKNSSYPTKSEQCRNERYSVNPFEQSKTRDELKSVKAKEYFNIRDNYSNEQSDDASSNSMSKAEVTLTDDFNKHTEPDKSCHMTRKQSKSQRKLKSKNTQSRIFFKRLFFRTPVPVTRITKT